MNKKSYLALSISGALLVTISAMIMPDTLKLITGILMGVGLSMSTFAVYKLLVKGKTEA